MAVQKKNNNLALPGSISNLPSVGSTGPGASTIAKPILPPPVQNQGNNYQGQIKDIVSGADAFIKDSWGNLNNIAPIAPIQLPEIGQIEAPISYLPKIEELGQQRLDIAQRDLQNLFGQQREQLTGRAEARGLTGSGAAEDLYQRQGSAESQQMRQVLAEVNAQNIQEQLAEMQRVGTITAEQASQRMELEAQRAIAQGDFDKAIAISNKDTEVAIAGLKNETFDMVNRLKMAGIELGSSIDYQNATTAIERWKARNQDKSLDYEAFNYAAAAAQAFAPEGGDNYARAFNNILSDMGYDEYNFDPRSQEIISQEDVRTQGNPRTSDEDKIQYVQGRAYDSNGRRRPEFDK